jgi:hypothetical protein
MSATSFLYSLFYQIPFNPAMKITPALTSCTSGFNEVIGGQCAERYEGAKVRELLRSEDRD